VHYRSQVDEVERIVEATKARLGSDPEADRQAVAAGETLLAWLDGPAVAQPSV
jgi:hypothetical protein